MRILTSAAGDLVNDWWVYTLQHAHRTNSRRERLTLYDAEHGDPYETSTAYLTLLNMLPPNMIKFTIIYIFIF